MSTITSRRSRPANYTGWKLACKMSHLSRKGTDRSFWTHLERFTCRTKRIRGKHSRSFMFFIGLPLFACVRPSPPRIRPSARMMSREAFSGEKKKVMKYSHLFFFFSKQTRLLKRKESYTEVYSSSTCLDPSPSFFFLPNAWDGEELGALLLLLPADRILLLLSLTASSGSREPLLPPLPPSSSSSRLGAAGRVGINHLCSRCDAWKMLRLTFWTHLASFWIWFYLQVSSWALIL